MHLNDSKKPLGSRVDRHECLGKGEIGEAPFHYIMTHSEFEGIPLILETIKSELWAEEIKWLRSIAS